MTKVKLFTHNDLDGCGCAILASQAYTDLSVELCKNKEISEKVSKFLDNIEGYELLLITDISVDKETADKIDVLVREEKISAVLLDHHKTALWLNDYAWSTVNPEWPWLEGNQPACGTNMLFTYLVGNQVMESSPERVMFTELVRRYDTWEWDTKYKDMHAKDLNDLLYIMGQATFINRFGKNIDPVFSEGETLVLYYENKRIEKYIKDKEKELIVQEIKGYQAGIVFAETNQSSLGNELAKTNPELDFIVMIDTGGGGLSFRTIHDVDLGALARENWGGGGHPKAAGASFDLAKLTTFIGEILK